MTFPRTAEWHGIRAADGPVVRDGGVGIVGQAGAGATLLTRHHGTHWLV